MRIVGSNIYKAATQLLTRRPYRLQRFDSRSVDEYGLITNNYLDPEDRLATMLAVSAKMVRKEGLDAKEKYLKLYDTVKFQQATRDKAGDLLFVFDEVFEIIAQSDWYEIDGWNWVMAVRINSNAEQ